MSEFEQCHLELANAQPLTLPVFAEAFRKMQHSRSPALLAAFGPPQLDDSTRLACAFAWADRNDLLSDLVYRIVNKHPTEAFLNAARQAGVRFGDAALQATVDFGNPGIDTLIYGQKMPRWAGQICRVLLDGRPKGTGFLVAPRLVATAYHVVADCVEFDSDAGRHVAESGSNQRLEFEFGNAIIEIEGVKSRNRSQFIAPQSDWLVAASDCLGEEWRGCKPDDPEDFRGHYDFALCRLASIVQIDMQGIELERDVRLGPHQTHITILHHPKGNPLLHLRASAGPAQGAPYRVPHLVNTDAGSSGAPCLNDSMRVVAMHQAGPKNGPCRQAVPENTPNRCVPIQWLGEAMQHVPAVEAGLMPIAELDDGSLVFGRSAMLAWITDTLTEGVDVAPILAVQSDGLAGLSFSGRLMEQLLPADQHQVIRMNTRDFDGRDRDAAIALLRDAACLPRRTNGAASLTAEAAHLRYEIVQTLVTELTGQSDVWIFLDDFDRDLLDGQAGGTRDLFDSLFASAGAANHLRFVLGVRSAGLPVPAHVARLETEALHKPDRKDFETYLRVSGTLSELASPDHVKIVVGGLASLAATLPADRSFFETFTALTNGDGP